MTPSGDSRFYATAPDGVARPGLACVGCGYDIRGMAPDRDCPECGRPIADSLSQADGGVALDADGRLAESIPCRRCGYDLHGVAHDGVCPECGTAVGWTLVGDLLKFADPVWVDKLRLGFKLILILIVVGFVGTFAMGLLGATGDVLITAGGLALYTLGVTALAAMAYWKATEPEPGVIDDKPTARAVARWAVLGGLVLALMANGMQVAAMLMATSTSPGFGTPMPGPTPSPAMTAVDIAAIVLQLASGLIGIVGYLAMFLYARTLALRVPNQTLARQTRIVMWGFVITYGLMIVGGAAIALSIALGVAGGGTSSGAGVAGIAGGFGAGAVMCVAGVGVLVFSVWSIVLIAWYTRVLTRATEEARRSWAA
jgi:hypothetical protein